MSTLSYSTISSLLAPNRRQVAMLIVCMALAACGSSPTQPTAMPEASGTANTRLVADADDTADADDIAAPGALDEGVSTATVCQPQCTTFTAEQTRIDFRRCWNKAYGDAGQWVDRAPGCGFTTSANPADNSIFEISAAALNAGGRGHVGVVHTARRNVDGTYDLTVSDANWNLKCGVRWSLSAKFDPATRRLKFATGSSWYATTGFITKWDGTIGAPSPAPVPVPTPTPSPQPAPPPNPVSDFELSVSSTTVTVGRGETVTMSVTLVGRGNTGVTVSLSAIPPANTVVNITPNPMAVTPGSRAAGIITVGASVFATTGTIPLTVEARGGGVVRTVTVMMTIASKAPPDFAVQTSTSSISIQRGGSGSFTTAVRSLEGFNGAVSLTAHNIPGSVLQGTGFVPQVVVPSPNSVTSSTFTLVTNSSTPTGTYTLTIRGQHGATVRTATVNVTISGSSCGGQFCLGDTVVVSGTGSLGLRLRQCARVSCATVATMPEGTRMSVFAGPMTADGHTWWALAGYVQGAYRTGWAADAWLRK